MGEVYLAEDNQLDRKVAIKVLNKRFSSNLANIQRFIREAKAASALNHPNILVIHEIGESDNAKYIVSEYVAGRTLREVLKHSRIDVSVVLDVAIQVAGLCLRLTASGSFTAILNLKTSWSDRTDTLRYWISVWQS